MGTVAAVAVVGLQQNGQPLPGIVGKLVTGSGMQDFVIVSNKDGYDEFKEVPLPFSGVLRIAGTAKFVEYPLTIPADAVNVTLRLGGQSGGPFDQVFPAVVPFKPASVLPAPPTREQVCGILIGFQGCTAVTKQYGTFPMFGPETTTLDDADLDAYCAEILAQGFTHGEIAVSWQYAEPGFLMPVPGRDLSNDLPELIRRVTRMLTNGLTSVVIFLAGDGRSAPKNPDGTYPYNDPVGHTYGCEWLMDNLPRIVGAFKEAPAGDLTKYVVFVPGYDGVFYGWGNLPSEPAEPDLQPTRIKAFGTLFRQVCPDGYLGLEHSTGHIPTGEGTGDWTPEGTCGGYDVLLSEFDNWPSTGDPTWQIAARTVPIYTRPLDQPSGDDPNPPKYLAAGSARGPFFAVAYEYATFVWTRGRISEGDVQQARSYYRGLGYKWVC